MIDVHLRCSEKFVLWMMNCTVMESPPLVLIYYTTHSSSNRVAFPSLSRTKPTVLPEWKKNSLNMKISLIFLSVISPEFIGEI